MYLFVCVALFFAVCNGQAVIQRHDECKIRNGYFNVDGTCDTYYECRDYQRFRSVCPDGLNFNPNTPWPEYPCSYPTDAPCLGRGVTQPAKPTDECPHQYGFFPSPTAPADDCGQYRLCAEGRAFDMVCPFGLAFNRITARCDWPELVPNCNTEAFLGFSCPAAEYDVSGNPIVTNFRYEGDCYLFFSCQAGRARLLSCDPGLAFDPVSGRCVDADLVDCEQIYSAEDKLSTEEN